MDDTKIYRTAAELGSDIFQGSGVDLATFPFGAYHTQWSAAHKWEEEFRRWNGAIVLPDIIHECPPELKAPSGSPEESVELAGLIELVRDGRVVMAGHSWEANALKLRHLTQKREQRCLSLGDRFRLWWANRIRETSVSENTLHAIVHALRKKIIHDIRRDTATELVGSKSPAFLSDVLNKDDKGDTAALYTAAAMKRLHLISPEVLHELAKSSLDDFEGEYLRVALTDGQHLNLNNHGIQCLVQTPSLDSFPALSRVRQSWATARPSDDLGGSGG